MDLDKILTELYERFKKPYNEFYDRRIIFWIDRDREFEDKIDNLEIKNVKIVIMSENNKFRVKKLLSFDDQHSDFLVYCPLTFNKKEDNWINDIMRYSEEFRADLVSIQIDEMNLPNSIAIRKSIKEYKKFFNAKSRRERIKKKSSQIQKPAHLELSIMSDISGCKMQPELIIREVLKAGIDEENNDIYQKFINYEISDTFWRMVEQGTGYYSKENKLEKLLIHIMLTASSRNINKEAFTGLDNFISIPFEAFCFQFVDNWLRNTHENISLYKLARFVEKEIKLDRRLMSLNIEQFENNEIFPCVDEVILVKLMTNIKNDIIDTNVIYDICDKRRVGAWYKGFETYYEGIYNIAKMKDFYNKNQASFHMSSAKEVWKTYTDKFYLMDTYYRKFHRAYQKSLSDSNPNLDDLFKFAVDRAEGMYKHWYLDDLLTNWCNVSESEFAEFGKISGVKQQINFYRDNIKDVNTKVYVIISDAMRYEVGKELSMELKKDMQCKIDMNDMLGVFPTITPFGMAALLPNDGIQTEVRNDNLKVIIDGQSTDMPNRETILQKYNKKSRVLKYDELIHMKREERKSKVKGMEVVYIYHDQIDASSHTSDSNVFYACDNAIDEIKSLVKILVQDFSAVNIMITSDHGFLYTHEEFTEEDKVSKEGFEGVVDYGRRYAIMDKHANPRFLMPIKFIDDQSELKGFSPKQNIRIKKRGGGINFVHGGISLQEMVIPLIKYRHLRNDNKEYQANKNKYDVKPVDLNILSTGRKISNMIFNMSFYQSEMLTINRESANYLLYFVDEFGKRISDEVRIIADRNTDDEQDRVFEVTFNLKSGKYDNTNTYNLVIYEESGQILPKKIEFVIDIPFATGDFDFFS